MSDDEVKLRFMAENPEAAERMEALGRRIGEKPEQTHVFTEFHSPKVVLEKIPDPVTCQNTNSENNPKGYVNVI